MPLPASFRIEHSNISEERDGLVFIEIFHKPSPEENGITSDVVHAICLLTDTLVVDPVRERMVFYLLGCL
jgi:hypothetical protein